MLIDNGSGSSPFTDQFFYSFTGKELDVGEWLVQILQLEMYQSSVKMKFYNMEYKNEKNSDCTVRAACVLGLPA